jgi:uncharacterized membrane protein (UPF0127 family)
VRLIHVPAQVTDPEPTDPGVGEQITEEVAAVERRARSDQPDETGRRRERAVAAAEEVTERIADRPAEVDEPRERVLAEDVDLAEGPLSQARGLMFRRSLPEGSALAFRFPDPRGRSLHMLFVPFPIDAVWTVADEVTKVKRLRSWVGLGWGTADAIYELPAGAADAVEPGDTVRLVEE